MGFGAFGMISFCLNLVRTLDPGECHLAEEGFVGVVTHDPRQTQAFERFLLILYRHPPPPQYTDQQRLIGVQGSGKIWAGTPRARMSVLLTLPWHPEGCSPCTTRGRQTYEPCRKANN
jgi:hypothetical protein